jgi:hypothetical protein
MNAIAIETKAPATMRPKSAARKAVAGPIATDQPSAATRAPAAVNDFDTVYASKVTTGLVDEVATADAGFLDHPEIDTSTAMGFLSSDMARLLNAGIPPVANKAHYFALVTTLEKIYGTAADQLPDNVVGAAATYTVARQATSKFAGSA